jgi:hypothetical protein
VRHHPLTVHPADSAVLRLAAVGFSCDLRDRGPLCRGKHTSRKQPKPEVSGRSVPSSVPVSVADFADFALAKRNDSFLSLS